MPLINIHRRLPDIQEYSNGSFNQAPGACADQVQYSVTLDISKQALEALAHDIKALTVIIEKSKGQNRAAVARRRRCINQRAFIHDLGWVLARDDFRPVRSRLDACILQDSLESNHSTKK